MEGAPDLGSCTFTSDGLGFESKAVGLSVETGVGHDEGKELETSTGAEAWAEEGAEAEGEPIAGVDVEAESDEDADVTGGSIR